jgi:ankyrin repeat protein
VIITTEHIYAYKSGNYLLVYEMLSYIKDINVKLCNGKSILHYTYISNHSLTEALLEHGADINIQDKKGRTILHKYIMKRKKIPSFVLNKSNHILDNNGDTPFSLACKYKRKELVSFFLSKGIDH